MGKLIVFAALLAALLAVANATTYTTVVTTTMNEEENPRGESCMQEYEQEGKLRHCQMYMQGMMGRFDASFLRTGLSNPRGGQEHLQQCCQQMEQISSPCRCEAMKMMWREQQQEMGSRREQMQEMREMMENLPQMCGMRSPQRCRMSHDRRLNNSVAHTGAAALTMHASIIKSPCFSPGELGFAALGEDVFK